MRFKIPLSHPGPQKSQLTLLRRSEQTGIISRGFSVRWTAALLLMGSVGAAWALSPTQSLDEIALPSPQASEMFIEGEPQVMAPLLGSLFGDLALSSSDRELMSKATAQRMVWRSKPARDPGRQDLRDTARFLKTVEEVEEQYLDHGAYPPMPPNGAADSMTYRSEGQDFVLGSGNRRYSTQDGISFGVSPLGGTGFELVGMLRTQEVGWGPWRRSQTDLVPQKDAGDTEGLEFLTEEVPASRSAARLFFPIDRATSGYLFRQKSGSSLYQSGELVYDAALGTFSLKLFRQTPATGQALAADLLEAEATSRDGALVLVGDQGLLSDLGLATPGESAGEGVVSLSSPTVMSCSVSSALDGLRLATLARHQENLTPGLFLASSEEESRAVVAGRIQLVDKLGQLHQLHLRAGRGGSYDWVVGQVCPVQDEPRAEGFVDSQAFSTGEGSSLGAVVKAGQ